MSEQADPGGSSAVRRGTTIVLPPLIKAVMKRDWHGREHIPRDGGVIIAPNHLSYADWAAVALFIHEAGRYPAFLIKSSAFDVKLLGPFLRALRPVAGAPRPAPTRRSWSDSRTPSAAWRRASA